MEQAKVEQDSKGKLNWILKTGWHGCCPACGEGRMFRGWIKLAKTCSHCGLDYGFASPDDGPAFFVMMILSFPLVGLAIWMEMVYAPPIWVHVLTSGPAILLSCIAGLRPLKGWLVSSQYVNKAQEAGSEALARKLRESAK